VAQRCTRRCSSLSVPSLSCPLLHNPSSMASTVTLTASEVKAESQAEEVAPVSVKNTSFLSGFIRILQLFNPFRPEFEKFSVHRVFGFIYLVLWFSSLYYYFADYDFFQRSHLLVLTPAMGVMQSVTATYYFSFLPKRQVDPGYYSDKSALSYNFVKENIFFAILLLFQCVYYTDSMAPWVRKMLPVEYFFVFLPYYARFLFPKTSFRDSIYNEKNKSDENKTFFTVVAWITKIFYMWAKHFIGYFLNYARFLDRITAEHQYHMALLLIFSSCATTISMFLHTLKFKRLLGPKTSYLIYMSSYLATFYGIVRLMPVFFASTDLCLITIGGMLANFGPPYLYHSYQIVALGILHNMRATQELATGVTMLA
jgi:hypothetical protein